MSEASQAPSKSPTLFWLPTPCISFWNLYKCDHRVCSLLLSIFFFFARFIHIGAWSKYFHPMHITLFIYLTVDIHLVHFQFNAIINITAVDCLVDTIGGRTPLLRTPFPVCFGSTWEGGSEAVAVLYSEGGAGAPGSSQRGVQPGLLRPPSLGSTFLDPLPVLWLLSQECV